MSYTAEEMEFYKERFPALENEQWKDTGARAFGYVRWRILIGVASFEELAAPVQIGLIIGNKWAKYFVDIKSTGYPDKGHTVDLKTVDPYTIGFEELERIARGVALENLRQRAPQIRADVAAYEAELREEDMRSALRSV